ncbi:MAG: hypothetical protein V1918_10445 [Planctomycetota bacterium]
MMKIRAWLLGFVLITGLLWTAGCGEGFLPAARRKPYGNIEVYKKRLEAKLLREYRNHPEFGEEVNRVELDVVKDILTDESGRMRRAEFAQLVYDRWGRRIPELEDEYFVATFGPGHPQALRQGPKITVGLAVEGTYSEFNPEAEKAPPKAR